MNRHNRLPLTLIAAGISAGAFAWTPKAVKDDPVVRMPGTQPGQVIGLDSDKQCLSCHAGAVYEMEHWKGSMMGQASRDPLFWAAMTVTAQDSVWALGNPNAADLCMRCHFPMGWLDGRSDPPNASLMIGEDYEGVSCKICHYMYDPHFKETYEGTREGNDWLNYWDETNLSGTPSTNAALATFNADAAATATISKFNGTSFFTNNAPIHTGYTENTGGQYFIIKNDLANGGTDLKRGPFTDANAKHGMLYSRYHKSKHMCGTCHDVSNAALANHLALVSDPSATNALPSEIQPAAAYFHIERTFSEFMLSGFNTDGGITGTGPWSPDRFTTSRTGNKIGTCQDCHFRDIDGVAAGKTGVIRPAESTEHPKSGVPQHRMIGGNSWVPALLASIDPASPNYDPVNEALLKQGPAALTLDFSQGEALDPVILLEASALAARMLQDSMSMTNAAYDIATATFSMRLLNHTPHKLISGFPEGRRMFLNVKAYVGDELIYEVNPYDYTAGTLKGLHDALSSPKTGLAEKHVDELVYEVMHQSDLLATNHTFHIALATGRYKDNRIPPRGFRIHEAAARLSEPVWHGVSDTNYFTADEYAGGYDDIEIELPAGTERIEAGLYYQTTSREFVEFLRDEINGTTNLTLSGTGAGGDPAYIAQTNDWFSGLAAWGDTIWQIWEHNMNEPGVAPVLMTNTFVQLDVSDTDNDEIPAYWETLHFSGPTNAAPDLDSDGDGASNYSEYVAFTDPLDSNSVLRLDSDFYAEGAGTEVWSSFDSRLSRFYAIEETPSLNPVSWSNLTGNVQGNDDIMVLIHTNTQAQSFFRLKAMLPE